MARTSARTTPRVATPSPPSLPRPASHPSLPLPHASGQIGVLTDAHGARAMSNGVVSEWPHGQLEGPGMPVARNFQPAPADANDGMSAAEPDGDVDDNKTYCFCDGVSYGEMIGCDDEDCEREWVRRLPTSCFSYFGRLMSLGAVPPRVRWSHHAPLGRLVLRVLHGAPPEPEAVRARRQEEDSRRSHCCQRSSRMIWSCSLCGQSHMSSLPSLLGSSLWHNAVCMYALMFALICVLLRLDSIQCKVVSYAPGRSCYVGIPP